MSSGAKRFLGIALLALLAVTLTAREGLSIQRSLLIEYFDKDQSDRPTQQWPWQTPLHNVNQRWHYNPQAPYYRNEPVRTDYSWGVQNYLYNSYIRQREEFPQSIWCAYTNRNDINHPRWPEDDLYEHNQNAWTWWGPFNLTNAVNAGISFWYYVDVQYGSRDSLSVVVANTANNMTLNGNAFRTNLAFGAMLDDSNRVTITKFPFDSRDWQRREFWLDSLRMINAAGQVVDTISYIGERTCYLAFVWQSNDRVIDVNNGKGAFIDDVMVLYDDGLFEIQPELIQYGYPVDEENIDWNTNYPQNNDRVNFRLQWRANGTGECGPFNIRCLLDGEEIYTEERTVIARADTVFITTLDTLWEVTSGEHTIRWELDTPVQDGGQIEESDEDNNVAQQTWLVEWNPPPTFNVWNPENDSTRVGVEETYRFNYTIDDSNETDNAFTVFMFWTDDITGLNENPSLIYDYHYINHVYNAERGNGTIDWDLSNAYEAAEIDTGMVIYICGFASDGFLSNQTNSIAPGRIWVRPALSAVQDNGVPQPATFGLTRTYPNPFNNSLMIEYSVLTAGKTNISVFDLTGRKVQTLLNGQTTSGTHRLNWSPDHIGAGVYLVRLESAGKTSIQKAIYTP